MYVLCTKSKVYEEFDMNYTGSYLEGCQKEIKKDKRKFGSGNPFIHRSRVKGMGRSKKEREKVNM